MNDGKKEMDQKPLADIEWRCVCFLKRSLKDGCSPADLRSSCIMLIRNIYCAAGRSNVMKTFGTLLSDLICCA